MGQSSNMGAVQSQFSPQANQQLTDVLGMMQNSGNPGAQMFGKLLGGFSGMAGYDPNKAQGMNFQPGAFNQEQATGKMVGFGMPPGRHF